MRTVTITALLALAIGVAPINARPAHALTESELLALLAGAAAVAIIGKEINDRRDEASRAPTVRHSDVHQQKKRYGKHGYNKRRSLPARCLRTIERAGRRDRQVLAARCLKRNDVKLARLPESCKLSVRTDRGFRSAYGARCVKRNGWRIDNGRYWSR